MQRRYLDHASTSPMRPEAVAAMVEWLRSPLAADPGRIHTEGMATRAVVEVAREQVASLLGARNREVVLTSGATESIAAAVWGASERGAHIVLSAVEHAAVRLASAAHARVTVVGCDRFGRIDPDELLGAVRPDTAVVHVQWGNHEVGTLQSVADVVAACRNRGVLVHIDAAAAAGRVPIDFVALGADLMSVSAHKMGGPPGIGALLVRRGLRLRPLLLGGDQERARRAGLENVPALVAWSATCESLRQRMEGEGATMWRLSERLRDGLGAIDGVECYGHRTDRLPHIVCCGIAGVEPQAVLLGLDQAGIAAHSGSACSSEDLQPSPVLEAMGVDAHRSLRLSVGWSSTDDDIDAVLDVLPGIVARLRALRSSG